MIERRGREETEGGSVTEKEHDRGAGKEGGDRLVVLHDHILFLFFLSCHANQW